MDSIVLEPLASIETHLNALITSLTQTNTFSNAPQTAQDLLTDDANLTSALSLLQRHQQNYARILNLREEVVTLQEQLKDTVRKCVSLKQEIGQINPSILDSDSEDEDGDEEDEKTHVAEVDYHTLLTFAARVGKHNTIAAKEAEAEAVRRKIATKKASTGANVTINGTQTTAIMSEATATQDTTMATVEGDEGDEVENGTAETTAELSRIDNAIAIQRAQMGMSFPDAAALRTGALGQLQLFRERQEQQISGGLALEEEGNRLVQEAVDKEVGRMVRETESIAPEVAPAEQETTQFLESPVMGRREATATTAAGQASTSQQGQAPKPAKPRQKVDLDFSGDSEDDDDD